MASIKTFDGAQFLFYDPFGIHSPEYINSVATSTYSLEVSEFFWVEGNGYYTRTEYEQFIESFRVLMGNNYIYNEDYITPKDLRNFLKFYPRRGDNTDIKEYVIKKFTDLFENNFEDEFFPKNVYLIKNLFK